MDSRLFQHGLVDSTNERALAAIAAGTARHADVHVATGQSAGRGRLGRSWASASAEGLYVSFVLLPASAPNPAALTMGAGLAVLASAQALGARAARLKWPNDVLVDGAKLAGILVEARGSEPARPHAVVGVGLNVLQLAFPAELEAERAVTSLARLGCKATREQALAVLLAQLGPQLERACREPERVASDFARASQLVGRRVRVSHGRGAELGRLARLDLSGLELARDDGRCARIALEHAQAVETLD